MDLSKGVSFYYKFAHMFPLNHQTRLTRDFQKVATAPLPLIHFHSFTRAPCSASSEEMKMKVGFVCNVFHGMSAMCEQCTDDARSVCFHYRFRFLFSLLFVSQEDGGWLPNVTVIHCLPSFHLASLLPLCRPTCFSCFTACTSAGSSPGTLSVYWRAYLQGASRRGLLVPPPH